MANASQQVIAPAQNLLSTPAPWLRWRQQVVRDLAWVVASPPLLAPTSGAIHWLDSTACRQLYDQHDVWFAALDANPTALLASLDAQRDRRLGRYFETLLSFWLQSPANTRYRLIAQNLPIRAQGITLGELDFLVQDRLTDELQHWEVAVKFYLGIEASGDLQHWIGPGQKDRLDLKLAHLQTHQLQLPRSAAGRAVLQALGLPEPTPVCLLKGRLFYPYAALRSDWAPTQAAADHLQGWWQTTDAFLASAVQRALRWVQLPKPHWFTSVQPPTELTPSLAAHELVASLQNQPVDQAIAVMGSYEGVEVTRGFLVANTWRQAYKQRQTT